MILYFVCSKIFLGDNMTDKIRAELFALQDLEYKNFQCKLMPTVDPDTVIGVRTPALREMAKRLINDENVERFLCDLPHKYYEENNLHAYIIGLIKDFGTCINALENFLPHIDNWATCDGTKCKCFAKNTEQLLPHIENWICSNHTYTVRFGILTLMSYFLDDKFKVKYLERVSRIKSDEYYINMMLAWYFATALAKQYDSAVGFIEQNRLALWVHNKTIQKAIESYRITDAQKEYLKSLKRKEDVNKKF